MTNDEIEKALKGNAQLCGCLDGYICAVHQMAIEATRSLVSQAYEEAAQLVESAPLTSGVRPKFPIRGGGPYPQMRSAVGVEARALAERIRALKPSSVEEPVSSPS